MNYSDYFGNKVEAQLTNTINVIIVVLYEGRKVIKESLVLARDAVSDFINRYDYSQVELSFNTVTIYLNDTKKI